MLLVNSVGDNSLFLVLYMFIYNSSLIIFFWLLFSIINFNFKTLYSLNEFSFNSYYTILISILLFSMAGVPPFIGFFSKILLLLLLFNNSLYLLYFLFFLLLFLGLYFYIQNIKFIHSTNKKSLNLPFIFFERLQVPFYYFTNIFLFFIIFGFVLIDDILLIFTWYFC